MTARVKLSHLPLDIAIMQLKLFASACLYGCCACSYSALPYHSAARDGGILQPSLKVYRLAVIRVVLL